MFPENKSISPLSMSSPYYEKLERQKALCQLLKQIVSIPATDPERQNAIEAVVLTIDQLSVKKKLPEHYRKYYDAAIEVTQRDVRKNIADFPARYSLNVLEIDERDSVGVAKVEKCFISWVLMILKTDCIDEHRKTTRSRDSRQKKVRNSKNKQPIKRPRGIVKDTLEEVSFDNYLNSQEDFITGFENKFASDIEGKFIGDISKNYLSLDSIESLIAKEQSKQKPMAQRLKEYIEQDPDNKLKELHPRNQADCNCQVLLQLFLLEELSMDEVYERLKCQGCKKGTIRNYLTEHEEGSRKSCLKLIKQIANNEFNS